MKAIFIQTMFLLLCLSFNACVKEDFDRCTASSSLRLYLTFQEESASRGRAAGEIRRVDAYVFDNREQFVGHWSEVLSGDYIELRGLADGEYKVVVWANMEESYAATPFIAGESSLADGKVSLVRPADNTLRDRSLSPLFFGQHPGASVTARAENHYTIALESNLYTLNFKVEGLARNEDNYLFTVTDDNTCYRFDNSFVPMPDFRYITTARFGNEATLESSMTVLRLARDRSPVLTLHHETALLYSGNLVELILLANAQGAGIDFRTTHTLNITFHIDANMNVDLSINGWHVETDEGPIS
jgi:hypothetical protein